MKQIIQVVWVVLVFGCLAKAQTPHYIRAGATGANNGNDWTNAFTQLPNTLVRGDTYYVADGKYPSYTFDDQESGTTVITIKKATIADHGTDTGWVDGYGDGQGIFDPTLLFNTGYYVLDGQRRTTRKSGHGFKIDNKTTPRRYAAFVNIVTNVIFRYLEIEGFGLDSEASDGGPLGFGQESFRILVGADCVVEYSYTHHDYVPIKFGSAHRTVIQYSTFGPNSYSTAAHSEAITDENSSDVVVRYNHFEDIEGTGQIIVLDRGTGGTVSNNWEIYGNVFMYHDGNPFNRSGNGNGAIACINSETCNNWKIYNNSFISMKYGSSPNARITFVASVGSGHEIYNNIWYDCDDASHHGNYTADYNYYILTSHRSEPNEQLTPTSDPFVDWRNEKFSLVEGTNAGFNTNSSLPDNDIDLTGVTRGVDGLWDRGVLEFVELIARPEPPTNLIVTVVP